MVAEDDEDLILRGGDVDPGTIRRDAQRMFDVYGSYGISVFALRGARTDELAQEAPLVRFPHFTVMTVRTIRALGLQLEPTGRNRRHYTLTLRWFDDDIEALVSADPGAMLLAGNRAVTAVVRIVAVDEDGQVHFSVLPGSVEKNRHLLGPASA